MKSLYTLLIALFMSCVLSAQQKYLDNMFTYSVVADTTYGVNISVLAGAENAFPEDLLMDVYLPNDGDTSRPLILIAHTGNFLPQVINRQATGSRKDSTVVYAAKQLASKGYVVAAYTYRLGWNPLANSEIARRGQLLQAVYRSIQDTRTCIRFFRKSVAESDNPFGIDPEKISVFGIGSGGYIALASATIYDYEEVNIDKFINPETALAYADTTLFGNIYGDTQATLCLPNHPGYDSSFKLAFNVGGALGDSSWIDGHDVEAAIAGVHATGDIFAPYSHGTVIVPTTSETVVPVSGTRRAVELANLRGNNDVFANINADIDPLIDLIEIQKQTEITLHTNETLIMGTDNFYSFRTPVPVVSPWDWYDPNTLAVIVAQINAVTGGNYSADTINASTARTNPNMSPEQGKAYMDTIINFFTPRACFALGLDCGYDITSVQNHKAIEANLNVYPNPTGRNLEISTVGEQYKMKNLEFVQMDGKIVRTIRNHNSNYLSIDDLQLHSGVYFIRIQTDQGQLTHKLVVN